MRAVRGFRFSRKRLIVPPLPAASRPSKTTTTRLPVRITSACSLTSSICSASSVSSYSRLLQLLAVGIAAGDEIAALGLARCARARPRGPQSRNSRCMARAFCGIGLLRRVSLWPRSGSAQSGAARGAVDGGDDGVGRDVVRHVADAVEHASDWRPRSGATAECCGPALARSSSAVPCTISTGMLDLAVALRTSRARCGFSEFTCRAFARSDLAPQRQAGADVVGIAFGHRLRREDRSRATLSACSSRREGRDEGHDRGPAERARR